MGGVDVGWEGVPALVVVPDDEVLRRPLQVEGGGAEVGRGPPAVPVCPEEALLERWILWYKEDTQSSILFLKSLSTFPSPSRFGVQFSCFFPLTSKVSCSV